MKKNRFKKKLPRTIPGLIRELNHAKEIKVITALENLMVCYFAVPLLALGSLLNYLLRDIMWPNGSVQSAWDSLYLFLLSGLFCLLSLNKLRTIVTTHLVSLLYSLILFFLTFRFYELMGPSVWTISFIMISLALVRVSRVMLGYVGISTLLSGIYVVFVASKTPYTMTDFYYIIQMFLFSILFLILLAIHKITITRFEELNEHYIQVVLQKDEMEGLYEELSASEEDLRQQNLQLYSFNKQIIKNEEHLNQLAHYDTLTGFPNRKKIMDRLGILLETAKNTNLSFYIVFIDLDNFKKINDTMGHHIGDLFIRVASLRIKNAMHEADMLGRIGGDEFALIIDRPIDQEAIFNYIDTIRKKFLEPFRIEKNDIRSSASFGIAKFPEDGMEAIELIKNADTAMYKAKENGKNNIKMFEATMKAEILKKIHLENTLLAADYNAEFYLMFQPQYNMSDGKVRGFEALIRWESKELGIVNPDRFVYVAEEMGIIVPLGEWILRKACEVFKHIQSLYHIDAVISVNVSVVQLEDYHFIEMVKRVLKETHLPPQYLEIEITESIFINSFQDAVRILNALKDLGVNIALDDFGTGYSSLSYLRSLPIDILKIDQSFVKDLSDPNSKKHIIGDIIALAHKLNIQVIAEGVEENSQLEKLLGLDCDIIQGFLMSNPLDLYSMEQFVEESPNCFHHSKPFILR